MEGSFATEGRLATSQCHNTSPLITKRPPGGRFATGDILQRVFLAIWGTFSNGGTFCNDLLRFGGRFVMGGRFATIFCVIWGDFLWGDVFQRRTFCNAIFACVVI